MTSVVDLLHTATIDRGCSMVILCQSGKAWQASVRQADSVTYRVELDADPINALKRALERPEQARGRRSVGVLTYASDAGTPGARPHNDLFGPL